MTRLMTMSDVFQAIVSAHLSGDRPSSGFFSMGATAGDRQVVQFTLNV